MRPARLFRMTPAEVAGRVGQEVRKRVDRIRLSADSPNGGSTVFTELAATAELREIRRCAATGDRQEAAEQLLARWRVMSTRSFFDGTVNPHAAGRLDTAMPEARAEILAAAESACRGEFDLLGYHALRFGDPPDWHLDPVSGRRAPLCHWSRIDPLDSARVGDSKVIWELNRHQWLVTLGQAYQLTGDERYAETFVSSVRRWEQANPPGFGINWASSLEVALRLISWCWALSLFRDARVLTASFYVEMLAGVHAHASHIERYLSHYFSPNTHLTGEALGLYYAGLLFPEFRRAPGWRAVGGRVLTEESVRQILTDGVHFERATCYQRYTAEIYLHMLLLAGRYGVPVAPTVRERLERSLDVLLALRRPDGTMLDIGDADGGSLLPLITRAPGDLRGVFSTAAVVFGRHDYAWAAEQPAPETLWLLGPAGVDAFERLAPRPPEGRPSRLFADGGFLVLRNTWNATAHQLVFDVGPLGCPVSAGHGHADLLSVQCAAFGQQYLVDAGTGAYTGDPEARDFFRGTRAHSTVMVDGMSQAIPAGPFSWRSRPAARLTRWMAAEQLEIAEAEHTAYGRLSDPVTHRRRVLWVNPRYWVIVDDLLGAAEHHVEVRFQFAPIDVLVMPGLWARAIGGRGSSLWIHAFADADLKAEVRCGELHPMQGWVSGHYGQRGPAPLLIYSAVTRLPLRVATLLIPRETTLAAPPAVSMQVGDRGEPVGLSFDDGETVCFGDGEELVVRSINSPSQTPGQRLR